MRGRVHARASTCKCRRSVTSYPQRQMVGDVAALIDRSGALFPDVDPSTVALWLLAMRAALMTDGVEDGTGPSAAHHDRSSACTARLSAATARWRVTASTGFESPSAAA